MNKLGDATREEVISALLLACQHVADSGQTKENAATAEMWASRFVARSAGRCLNYGQHRAGIIGPCGECAWCEEREFVQSGGSRRA